MKYIAALIVVAVMTGCAGMGPNASELSHYVDGYETFIGQRQAEDVIYAEAAEGTNVTFSLIITGAEKVAIAGIVPQRSSSPFPTWPAERRFSKSSRTRQPSQ